MFDTYTEQFVLFTCEGCGLESDVNQHYVGGHVYCNECYKKGVISSETNRTETERGFDKQGENVCQKGTARKDVFAWGTGKGITGNVSLLKGREEG